MINCGPTPDRYSSLFWWTIPSVSFWTLTFRHLSRIRLCGQFSVQLIRAAMHLIWRYVFLSTPLILRIRSQLTSIQFSRHTTASANAYEFFGNFPYSTDWVSASSHFSRSFWIDRFCFGAFIQRLWCLGALLFIHDCVAIYSRRNFGMAVAILKWATFIICICERLAFGVNCVEWLF